MLLLLLVAGVQGGEGKELLVVGKITNKNIVEMVASSSIYSRLDYGSTSILVRPLLLLLLLLLLGSCCFATFFES